MKKEQRQSIKEAATVAACGLFCLLVLVFFLYEPWRQAEYWFGDKPRMEIAISAGTLLAAVVAGLLAYFSYRVSLRADLASRLQKALDLMDGDSGKGAAAVALLVEVAKESKRYRRPVLDALMAYLTEYGADQTRHVAVDRGTLRYSGNFPVSRPNTNEVVRGISAINEMGDEEISADETAMFSLKAYMCGYRYLNLDLSGIVFSTAVVSDMTFDRCNMAGVRLQAVASEYVGFRKSDVSKLFLELYKPDGSAVAPADGLVIFHDCRGIETATVNGFPAREFEVVDDLWPALRG